MGPVFVVIVEMNEVGRFSSFNEAAQKFLAAIKEKILKGQITERLLETGCFIELKGIPSDQALALYLSDVARFGLKRKALTEDHQWQATEEPTFTEVFQEFLGAAIEQDDLAAKTTAPHIQGT